MADAPTYKVLHRAIVAEGARIRAIPGLLDRARAFLNRVEVDDLPLPEEPDEAMLPTGVRRGAYVRWLFHGFVAAERIDVDFTDWIFASARAGAWIECRPGNELRQPIDEKGNRLPCGPLDDEPPVVPVRIGPSRDVLRGFRVILYLGHRTDKLEVQRWLNEIRRWGFTKKQMDMLRGRPSPGTERSRAFEVLVDVLRDEAPRSRLDAAWAVPRPRRLNELEVLRRKSVHRPRVGSGWSGPREETTTWRSRSRRVPRRSPGARSAAAGSGA